MTRIYIFGLLIFCFSIISQAQFSEDFSSGVLDPVWTGERNKFTVENEILRLTDTEAGNAYLVRPSTMINNTQWDFWIRLGFEPSDNNYPIVYLTSSSDNLYDNLNGYFIRIGKSGGDNKRLFFYRQDGESEVQIMQGATNIAASNNNLMRFRVTRDNAGKWDFYVDPTGEELFLPQGSITDNTHTTSAFFGMKCVYTVSNSDRFYFDDIEVGDIVPDLEKPEVRHVVPVNSTTLDVHFTKAIDVATSETTTNYFISGIGAPTVAQRLAEKPYISRLVFSLEFAEEINYNIDIVNVQDVFGNRLVDYSGTFSLYNPKKFDVVFNELMANPTPPVELPPYKYIELYNTTEFQINIEGWTFQSGTDALRVLPFGIIPPNEYILLVNDPDLPYFQSYNAISSNLGVNFLTSGGRTIVLYDADGEIMHTVSYTDKWYNDTSRDKGGWSIEQIDPYNVCGGIDNWRASIDPKGGTPGEINSVDAENPNETNPDLVRAGLDDPLNITLFFSEPMDDEPLRDVDNYNINNGIGTPVDVTPVGPDFQKVRVQLATELQVGTMYEVTVSENFADCAGNLINNRNALVAIPQMADSLDVVVNELLFNSPTNVPRYIELYNRSQKVIDLSKYRVSSKDTIENILTSIREISTESYLLFPESYAVLTTNVNAVRDHYQFNDPRAFVQIETMPSMTNDDGIVVFSHQSQQIIDMIVYTKDMHYPLLTSKSGVALERLNPDRPTQDWSNWHSAAEGIGFGTPGMKNSQFTLNIVDQDSPFEVYPEIFSPDNTGHNDVLNISYEFEEPGYTTNITIFDSRGRVTKTLYKSLLLGTKGVVTWNGTTDDNQKAYIGIYIVHVELFDPRGNVKHYKLPAVLAGRL